MSILFLQQDLFLSTTFGFRRCFLRRRLNNDGVRGLGRRPGVDLDNLLGDRSEKQVDMIACGRRGLDKAGKPELLSHLPGFCTRHFAGSREIGLGAGEHDHHIAGEAVSLDRFVMLRGFLERLPVGEIERDHHAMRVSKKARGQHPEPLLADSIDNSNTGRLSIDHNLFVFGLIILSSFRWSIQFKNIILKNE